MIPARNKNILLLPLTDGGVTQPFNMPGFPGYDKSKNTHNGVDIGFTTGHQYYPILACQDGKVMAVIDNDVSGSRGNGIVLQHDYDDGTHRWTSYIHLKDKPTLKVGQTVKQGQQVGIRGGSPYINGKAKFGVHLHLYVTSVTTKTYTWNTMKSLVIDPMTVLYRSKNTKYDIINSSLKVLPILEDAIIEIVDPVPRNQLENQLTESSSKLRVRTEPSLKGTILGYLKPNVFYNFLDMKNADGYDWYQIADKQWVAKTSTMTIYPKKTEVDILKEEIEKLTKANEELAKQVVAEKELVAQAEGKNEQLVEEKKGLTKIIESLEGQISQAVSVLTSK